MYSRQDYLDHKCTHREYYAQFVTEDTKKIVLHYIGRENLLYSRDPYFNDIPLKRWDNLVKFLGPVSRMKETQDFLTSVGGVCILKEAANQLKEEWLS